MSINDKLKFQYGEGETVLCFHGPLLYEAKCVKFEVRNSKPHYLIHYSGWNKSWDEWVPCSRVLKYNDENLKKQADLLSTHGASKLLSKIKTSSRKSRTNSDKGDDKSSQDSSMEGGNGSTTASTKKKSKLDSSTEEDYVRRSEVNINIPDELRQILVDDYQQICNNNKLPILPAINTVDSLLRDYTNFKLEKQFDKNVLNATVEGIKDYFEACLSAKLLYKQERNQHDDFFKDPERKAVEVYGSFHLLRLFVKIGDYLSYTCWDEICTKQLILHLEDVLRYMNDNRANLFNIKSYYYMPKRSAIERD